MKHNARTGLPSQLGLAHTANLFFRYRKLIPETKIEDWLEFSKWVATIATERHTPFLNIIHFSGYEIYRHRVNVSAHVEKPSEAGIWKTLKELHEFVRSELKKGRSIPFAEGYLVKLRREVK